MHKFNTYKAAFILPTPNVKTLTESGWEFASPKTISLSLVTSLIEKLDLKLLRSEIDHKVYSSRKVELIISLDGDMNINNVYIKLYEISESALTLVFDSVKNKYHAELFFS